MTGSHALLLSRSPSAQVSDVIYMDISASGTFLSTRLNAVHLLDRRCFMEKYASLKKKKKKKEAISCNHGGFTVLCSSK